MKQIEHDNQCSFFEWLRVHAQKYPELKRFYAIPNGGQRTHATAVRLYLEGVQKGVLDTHLPLPRNGKAGLWIEFKAGSNQLTPAQREWKQALELEGHAVFVVHDWAEAVAITVDYLNLELKGLSIAGLPAVPARKPYRVK